jgi:hypothetical protein
MSLVKIGDVEAILYLKGAKHIVLCFLYFSSDSDGI